MKYNMHHSLFVVLPILLLGCISGYAQGEPEQLRATILFAEKQVTSAPSTRNRFHSRFLSYWTPPTPETPPRKFYTPYLMQVNGELVAMASATVQPGLSNNQYEIVDFQRRKSSDNGTKWNEEYERIEPLHFNRYSKDFVSSPDMKDYYPAFVLVESNNTPTVKDSPYILSTTSEKKDSILRIMEVKPEKSSSKGYTMGFASVLASFPFQQNHEDFIQFVGNTSSPILKMNSTTLVFPVQLLSRYNRTAAGVMYFKPDERVWKLDGVVSERSIYNPAVVEWENGKLMMIAQHDSGYYRVYESTNLGKNWKESTSTLSRVWTNSPIPPGRGSQNNFITATIDNKSVILFTQSVETEAGNELHLWLTDNTHIYHVGLISKAQKETTSTLLFKDDKLYCLYESHKEEDNHKVLFVNLTVAMKKIKIVLSTWTNQDTLVSKCHCHKDEKTCATCDSRIPTTGLVGYLSGNIDGDKWKDEYLCVDATVKGAIPRNGFKGLIFKGADAGAIWPVSTNRAARQYHFTNYAFTLVATVTIHEFPTESRPLLGVRLNKSKKEILLGVSYNKNKTWSTISKSFVKALTSKWKENETYSVVLTFDGGKGSVYIDGILIDERADLKIAEKEEISHFYFGEYRETVDGTHMTVTDVMLYNRVLKNIEIDALFGNKVNTSLPQSVTKTMAEELFKQSNNDTHTMVREVKIQHQNTTSQNNDTSIRTEATVDLPAALSESAAESAPQQESQSPVTETYETQENQQHEQNATEKRTFSSTPVPVSSTNTTQDLLQKTNHLMINNTVNAHKNKTIDGTVRIYESVLPMLVLGLWALATVFP
ncbi:trans-sialidase [Trypanosoma theileri]|uniref:Trans-sialidase n=1 Tax=Trypanosoma theileri TaxID=67003 RepID=A0A1X0P770_9TRYP|nr:trans-sialidase [Trypanosoma theileri]ORC92772.1 trans-sialidase [Trypanosoma theileri]